MHPQIRCVSILGDLISSMPGRTALVLPQLLQVSIRMVIIASPHSIRVELYTVHESGTPSRRFGETRIRHRRACANNTKLEVSDSLSESMVLTCGNINGEKK